MRRNGRALGGSTDAGQAFEARCPECFCRSDARTSGSWPRSGALAQVAVVQSRSSRTVLPRVDALDDRQPRASDHENRLPVKVGHGVVDQ